MSVNSASMSSSPPSRTMRVAAELGVVGGEEDLARVGDDRLRDAHLLVVEVEQGAVEVDAADPDHAEVDPELADQVDRRLADDAAVARAHHAAGDDHLEVGLAARAGPRR